MNDAKLMTLRAMFVVVIFVIFHNRQTAQIRLLFANIPMPLILTLLIGYSAGVVSAGRLVKKKHK